MMTLEERQLRSKLRGLRSIRTQLNLGMGMPGRGRQAVQEYKAKLKPLGQQIHQLMARLAELEAQRAKAGDPLRSTQAVLEHHLAAVDSGNLDDILSDHTADAVLLTPDRTYRGTKEIAKAFRHLLNDVFSTCSEFKMIRQEVEADVAFIAWCAESEKFSVPLATDTYRVRRGKIFVQTFTAVMEKK